MKKSFLLTLMLGLFACISISAQDNDKDDNDWDKKSIKGSGNLITKEFPVQPFEELNLSGICSIILTQGSKESVKIEADDNLMELFEVKNEGSQLVLSMKKKNNIKSKNKMKVYITFRKLKSMELKTVGDISSDKSLSFDDLKIENKSVGSVDLKFTSQSLNLENKSVGDVTLDGSADNAVIRNHGVGSLQAGGFVVQKMDIENTGVGSAEVNAAKEIKVKDSWLGKVTNKGSAPIKRLKKAVI